MAFDSGAVGLGLLHFVSLKAEGGEQVINHNDQRSAAVWGGDYNRASAIYGP